MHRSAVLRALVWEKARDYVFAFPAAVLAAFGDEREQELVVNPNMLRGRVELVQTIPTKRFAGAEPKENADGP